MADSRVVKFAQILVDHSTRVGPGDRVAITATTAAEPIARALFELVLERGGNPHIRSHPAQAGRDLIRPCQ